MVFFNDFGQRLGSQNDLSFDETNNVLFQTIKNRGIGTGKCEFGNNDPGNSKFERFIPHFYQIRSAVFAFLIYHHVYSRINLSIAFC